MTVAFALYDTDSRLNPPRNLSLWSTASTDHDFSSVSPSILSSWTSLASCAPYTLALWVSQTTTQASPTSLAHWYTALDCLLCRISISKKTAPCLSHWCIPGSTWECHLCRSWFFPVKVAVFCPVQLRGALVAWLFWLLTFRIFQGFQCVADSFQRHSCWCWSSHWGWYWPYGVMVHCFRRLWQCWLWGSCQFSYLRS